MKGSCDGAGAVDVLLVADIARIVEGDRGRGEWKSREEELTAEITTIFCSGHSNCLNRLISLSGQGPARTCE